MTLNRVVRFKTEGFFDCIIRMFEVFGGAIDLCVSTLVRVELFVAVLGSGKDSRDKRLLCEACGLKTRLTELSVIMTFSSAPYLRRLNIPFLSSEVSARFDLCILLGAS